MTLNFFYSDCPFILTCPSYLKLPCENINRTRKITRGVCGKFMQDKKINPPFKHYFAP